jgi:hypothetical protein
MKHYTTYVTRIALRTLFGTRTTVVDAYFHSTRRILPVVPDTWNTADKKILHSTSHLGLNIQIENLMLNMHIELLFNNKHLLLHLLSFFAV